MRLKLATGNCTSNKSHRAGGDVEANTGGREGTTSASNSSSVEGDGVHRIQSGFGVLGIVEDASTGLGTDATVGDRVSTQTTLDAQVVRTSGTTNVSAFEGDGVIALLTVNNGLGGYTSREGLNQN